MSAPRGLLYRLRQAMPVSTRQAGRRERNAFELGYDAGEAGLRKTAR